MPHPSQCGPQPWPPPFTHDRSHETEQADGTVENELENVPEAVVIRRLSQKEQVLAGTQFAHSMGLGPVARALAESDVPVVVGRDGYELTRMLPEWIMGGDLPETAAGATQI